MLLSASVVSFASPARAQPRSARAAALQLVRDSVFSRGRTRAQIVVLEAEPSDRLAASSASERAESEALARELGSGARASAAREVLECDQRCRATIPGTSVMVIHGPANRRGMTFVLIEVFALDRVGEERVRTYTRIAVEVRESGGEWHAVRVTQHVTSQGN